MNKVVIYPGRFQPMLSHHVAVYDYLVKQFSDADVYIGTSDKVSDTSPFNFKEKQMIAMAQGIDPNKVLFAPQPYVHTFYKQFDHENTIVIFAVGEKDMAERFAMTNIDPSTGLDMKVKEPEPKYYQMINSMKDTPLPMSKRGYLFEVPNIDLEGEVASATAFRNAIKNSPDKEAAKQIFDKQFREYNEEVFNLVYNKIVGNKMNEDINILRQLAGLDIEEGAPVEFEDHVEVKDIEFTDVSKSSSFHSIANRFPKGSDVNDMEVKKGEFASALVKSPASLLSEINERIKPDENGLAASEKLTKIINVVEKEGGSIMDLDEDDKKFAIELVKKSIKEMDLDAGDDSEYEPDVDEMPEESVDLSDIRDDYNVVQEEEPVVNEDPEGPSISEMSDEELMDYVGQREEDLVDDMQQHIAPDFLHKENFEEMFELYREEVLEPAAEEISQDKMADDMMGADESVDVDEAGCTPAHRKANKKKKSEAIDDTATKALEAAMNELRELAGLELQEGRMSDIHQDANSMSKEEFAKEHPMFADDYEGLQHEDDPNEPSQEEIDANYEIVKKYIGKNKKEESIEEGKMVDEAGCVAEMKKLYASGCTKESMYSKLNAEYNCNRKQFEELYAGHCG